MDPVVLLLILLVAVVVLLAFAFGSMRSRGRQDHGVTLLDDTYEASRLERKSPREHLLNATCDLAIDLVYYDRKEDEDLPRGTIERLIERGDITIEEILAEFESALRYQLREVQPGATAGTDDEEELG